MRKQDRIQLPKDWKWVKLGEVCKLKNGFAFKSTEYINEGIPVIRISDIKSGSVKPDKSVRVISKKDYEEYVVLENDILVAMSGATTGKFGIYKSKDKAYQNQRVGKFKILNIEQLDNEFLLYQLHALKRQIEKDAYGGAQPNISSGKIEAMEILLPPKPTQQAIVSKIEELFSELDKGIENLHTAQQQLKTYRQSVLKWAFEGRLTNENVKEGELPKGWKFQKLNDIGSWKGGGTPSKANKTFWSNGNILWVSPKDMKSKTIHNTIDKITSDAISNSSTKLIDKGSILFVVRSGILRRTLPVAITVSDVTVNQDLQAFTPTSVLPDYVYWYVQAKNEDIRRNCSKDGTTVESIESSLLKNYPIPICDGEEQNKLVQEIESRLSVADKMEESITQSLQQAEALRQSILKKAFEGKLV